jgi:hypothetical protein
MTQLTSPKNYDANNMIFLDPTSGSIPNSTSSFSRVAIKTKYPDGTTGDLILPTERLFSFGVSENKSPETGKATGWSFPLCLHNKDGASKEELEFTETFDKIINRCIDYLLDNREELDLLELTRGDLTKSKGGLNPLYWKKEKALNKEGKMVLRKVPGSGPTLYCKLLYSKKKEEFMTQFYDKDYNPLNPLELNGYCWTKAAIRFESIFIGSRISMQIKLYEAIVEPIASGMTRLLSAPPRPKVLEQKVGTGSSLPPLDGLDLNSEGENSQGSIVDDSGDEAKSPEPEPEPPKRTVRRVRRTKASA